MGGNHFYRRHRSAGAVRAGSAGQHPQCRRLQTTGTAEPHQLLFSLALADLLILVSLVLLSAENVYRELVGFSSFFITYLPGVTGVTWVSQFLSVVIAVERYVCVVSPLRVKAFFKTSSMAVFIFTTSALLWGGMVAIAGPKYTVVCMLDPATNQTKNVVTVTKYFLDNKKIWDILDIFVYATGLPAIFLVVVTVTTAITAVKLRHALLWRRRSTRDKDETNKNKISTKEAALTKMLITTSILFIVCLLPLLMIQIVIYFVRDLCPDGRYHNLSAVLWQCIFTLRCLNSSLNFFICYRMESRFRETLKKIVPSWCCKR